MDPDEQLGKIRDRIDAIDSQLLELISERARCAQEVAQVKLDASQSDEAPTVFYRPEREAQVLRAIQERNPGRWRPSTLPRSFGKLCPAAWRSSSRCLSPFWGPRAPTPKRRP